MTIPPNPFPPFLSLKTPPFLFSPNPSTQTEPKTRPPSPTGPQTESPAAAGIPFRSPAVAAMALSSSSIFPSPLQNRSTPTPFPVATSRRLISFHPSPSPISLRCSAGNDFRPPQNLNLALDPSPAEPTPSIGGGNGKPPTDDSFSGGGGGGGGEDPDEDEFGPVLGFAEVMRMAEERGVTLPDDMVEAAREIGIRSLILLRYLDSQGSAWPLAFLMRSCGMLRDRMLADPAFLFKVATEVVIDSCCATFAEVQKRGDSFWAEFELYAADLLVGVVVDIALVGLLAPYVRMGKPAVATGLFGPISRMSAALPSSVFEAQRPGCNFSIQQRIGTYFYKGVLYGSVGFFCGIVGQGIANAIMTANRSGKKSEDDVPVPPLVKSAALWGVFLAVSSNTRYQIINGLESLVEKSPIAKRLPPVAMAFTVGVRFANNVYGGMQFVDWARWSGVQ